MLILSRRAGQEVVIGSSITVRVVSVQGGTVRLGFVAPRGIRVNRAEVEERAVHGELPAPLKEPPSE